MCDRVTLPLQPIDLTIRHTLQQLIPLLLLINILRQEPTYQQINNPAPANRFRDLNQGHFHTNILSLIHFNILINTQLNLFIELNLIKR